MPVAPVDPEHPLARDYLFSEDKEAIRRKTLATTASGTIYDLAEMGKWREDILRAQRHGQQDPSSTGSFEGILLWYSKQPRIFNHW